MSKLIPTYIEQALRIEVLERAVIASEGDVERLERELAEAKAQRDKAIAFLHVYRNDTPLGNQPHMIAHDVDQFLKEGGK